MHKRQQLIHLVFLNFSHDPSELELFTFESEFLQFLGCHYGPNSIENIFLIFLPDSASKNGFRGLNLKKLFIFDQEIKDHKIWKKFVSYSKLRILHKSRI